jgi:hypothetical protein
MSEEEEPIEEEIVEEEKEVKPREKARTVPQKAKKPQKAAAGVAAPEAPKPKKIVYKKLKINYWRTGLHDEEIGVHQEMKYRAKTRWFSQNFDIEGVVEEDGKKKYIIAFNKQEWQESALEDKKLRCRIFTIMEESMQAAPTGGNFKGGVELSVSHSLLQSYAVKKPVPVFIVQIPANINLIRFQRGFRLLGAKWWWPLLPEEKEDKYQIVKATGIIGPGRNYKIYIGKKLIARVDGQPTRKNYIVEIFDEDYSKDKTFITYLILFACACNFMTDAIKLIKTLYKKMKDSGTTDYKPPKGEMDLYRNPRMMRR